MFIVNISDVMYIDNAMLNDKISVLSHQTKYGNVDEVPKNPNFYAMT